MKLRICAFALLLIAATSLTAQVQIGSGGSVQLGAGSVTVNGCGGSTPCPIANGGTGANSQSAAFTNIVGPGGTITGNLSVTGSISGPSIPLNVLSYNAVAGDTNAASNTVAIQNAINSLCSAGGGTLYFPSGTYRISSNLTIGCSNIKLFGDGYNSAIHLVNSTRSSLMVAMGSVGSPIVGIEVAGLRLYGDVTFTAGTPSLINGGGVNFVFTNNCQIHGNWISGFSDGGVSFLNGSNNSVSNNPMIASTAQGIAFNASTVSVTGNQMNGNSVYSTGEYDGLHLEGNFGGSGGGQVIGTAITGNVVYNTYERGINIELAPETSVSGNTVINSGLQGSSGGQSNISGIHLYGGLNSSIVGNTIQGGGGYALYVGANSGSTTISGNTTQGNAYGMILTDDAAASSYLVVIGSNNITELTNGFVTSGNVSFNTSMTTPLIFPNISTANQGSMNYYAEGIFTPTVIGGTTPGAPTYVSNIGKYTRIGNRVFFEIRIVWNVSGGYTGTGQLEIAGLPFAMAASFYESTSMWSSNLIPGAGNYFVGQISSGNTFISIATESQSTGALSAFNVPTTTATNYGLTISGEYPVY
jgi:hypothetical protein